VNSLHRGPLKTTLRDAGWTTLL